MKKVTRIQRLTRLVVVEGADDHAVLAQFHRLYSDKQKVTVKIVSAGGGDVGVVLAEAIRRKETIEYDETYCVFDTDRDEWLDKNSRKKFKTQAKTHNIKLLALEPLCLEGFLLKVFGKTKVNTSRRCKTELYRKFGILDKNISKILNNLDKDFLDERRLSFELLDELIGVFEVT